MMLHRRLLAPTTVMGVALLLVVALQATLGWQFDQAARKQSARGEQAGFPIDDAWIHQVYARSFATDLRLDYNPGEAEAGQSSLLWGVLLAPVQRLVMASDVPVGRATRLMGTLIWMLLALAVARLIVAMPIPGARFGAWFAALLIALDPSLAYSAASGMEPLLAALLVVLTIHAASAARAQQAGLYAGLAILARPESALVLLLASVVALGRGTPRARLTQLARTLLCGVAVAGVWLCFCLATTGRPLPNTWYVKRAVTGVAEAFAAGFGVADGLGLLGSWCARSPFFQGYVGYLFLGIGIVALLARCGGARAFLLLAFPLCHCVGIALTRAMPLPEAFFWERYLVPMYPVIHVLLAIGVGATGAVLLDLLRRPSASAQAAAAIEDAERTDPDQAEPAAALENEASVAAARPEAGPQRLPVNAPVAPILPDPVLAVILLILLFVPLAGAPAALTDRMHHFAADVAVIDAMNVAAGEWIREHVPDDALVATQDAGAVRYFADRTVVDLIGLNDHHLIDAGESEGSVGPYLLRRAPTVFALLDPDPGAAELQQFAIQHLGLTQHMRFGVPAYTPFLQTEPKAIVVLFRP